MKGKKILSEIWAIGNSVENNRLLKKEFARLVYAKMKHFALIAVNIRSQYSLFCKNRWIFNTKSQPRLVTVLS